MSPLIIRRCKCGILTYKRACAMCSSGVKQLYDELLYLNKMNGKKKGKKLPLTAINEGGNKMLCPQCSGTGTTYVKCPRCKGSGSEEIPCFLCKGTGIGMDGSKCRGPCGGTGKTSVPCKKCGGAGEVEIKCPVCHGTGELILKPEK